MFLKCFLCAFTFKNRTFLYIGRAYHYTVIVAFYIFFQQIYVLCILNTLHTLRFSLQNSVYFIMHQFFVPVLFTFYIHKYIFLLSSKCFVTRTSSIVITPWHHTGSNNTNKTNCSGFRIFCFLEILLGRPTITFHYRYGHSYALIIMSHSLNKGHICSETLRVGHSWAFRDRSEITIWHVESSVAQNI
jgi:hypothetical protein